MPFRLNAPQTESDHEAEGSSAFGGIGDRVEHPDSREFPATSNNTRSNGNNGSQSRDGNGVVSLASDSTISLNERNIGSHNADAAAFSSSAGRVGIRREELITADGFAIDGAHEREEAPDDNPKGARPSLTSRRSMRWLIGIGVISVALLVGLIVAVSLALTFNNDSTSDAVTAPSNGGNPGAGSSGGDPNQPGGGGGNGTVPLDDFPPLNTTLGRIYNEGILRCGIPVEQAGFAFTNPNSGRMEGFDADLCRAVAAGIFGPNNLDYRVEYHPVTGFDRWRDLKDQRYDVLARTTTHTMEREVLEPTTGSGFSFSIPYLYNGMQFAGVPVNVDCADNATLSDPGCEGTKICALDGTTHIDIILQMMPEATVVAAVNPEFQYTNFISGFCNVIASEQFDIAEVLLRDRGYTGEYKYGSLIHSKEPLCLVTRDDDPQFSDFVNWIMEALISAEEGQITQDRAVALPLITEFGPALESMSRDAVSAVGNYGEVYARNLEPLLPRSITNTINDGGEGGLLYAFPFGNVNGVGGMGPVPDGTLSKILERGFLKCGISERVIFARSSNGNWSGFDVDFCKALSAAVFRGVTDTIEYTDLSASERFVALASGDVDVLSRLTTVTLARDVNEPATMQGFHFTQPNFYDGMLFGGIPPYGQCADDLVIIGASCQNILICVNTGTTFEKIIKNIFPERVIVTRDDDALDGLSDGSCNVIAGGVSDVSATTVRSSGYLGAYQTGSGRFSKDPLAMVTREDDVQFAKFVYWIVSGIFYAEEEGITMNTSDQMPEASLFGEQFKNMFIDAIGAVGNYGEIYTRSAEEEISRSGLNDLNQFLATPQLYPLPGIL